MCLKVENVQWFPIPEVPWGTTGAGPYGVFCPCSPAELYCFETEAKARNFASEIAETRCGGSCNPASHRLYFSENQAALDRMFSSEAKGND